MDTARRSCLQLLLSYQALDALGVLNEIQLDLREDSVEGRGMSQDRDDVCMRSYGVKCLFMKFDSFIQCRVHISLNYTPQFRTPHMCVCEMWRTAHL